VKQGQGLAFVNEWKSFARWSMETQPGALRVELLEDEKDRLHFITIGEWEDREDVNAWRQTPEFKAFIKKIGGLCERFEVMNLKVAAKIESGQLVG
jgi:quinol monooxygenase YgiN